MQKSLFLSCLFLLVLTSCTITKRHYRKGFYIEWHHRYPQASIEKENEQIVFSPTDTVVPPALLAGNEKQPVVEEQEIAYTSGIKEKTIFHQEKLSVESKKTIVAETAVRPLLMAKKVGLGDDTYVDEGYALRRAKMAFWLGLISLVLMFILGFWCLIISGRAIKAGRQALIANDATRDLIVEKKARSGILLATIQISLCEIVLFATGIMFIAFILFISGLSADLITFLAIMAVIFLGLWFLLHRWKINLLRGVSSTR